MGKYRVSKLIAVFVLLFCVKANAQYDNGDTFSTWQGNMSIGAGKPKLVPPASTALVIGKDSTNKAVILPRILDTALITSPTKGMTVYVIPLQDIYLYDGTKWKVIGSSNITPPTVCQGLIFPGVVTLASGLILNVTPAQYCIANVTYNSPPATLTLTAADATFARKDIIVVNTSSVAVIKTGTPAANPIAPTVNPSTEIYLTTVDVPANATTPSNITREVIYNENIEWTTSNTLSAGSVSFTGLTNPFIGTKTIDASSGTLGSLKFTKSDTINIQDWDVLQTFIRLKGAVTNTVVFQIAFTLGGVEVTDYVTFDNTVGFVYNSTGSYQNVAIPVAKFTIGNSQADGVIIKISGANTGYYLDYIQLQKSIVPPYPSNDSRFLFKYLRDTGHVVVNWLDTSRHVTPLPISTNRIAFPSPGSSYITNHPDTLTPSQKEVGFITYAQDAGPSGVNPVRPAYIVRSLNSPFTIISKSYMDGSIEFANGLLFDKNGTRGRVFGLTQEPIEFLSQSPTQQYLFSNGAGSALTGTEVDIQSSAGYVLSQSANTVNVKGDANQQIFQIRPRGVVAINAPVNDMLSLDVQGIGQGFRGDTMNTVQRDGMNKFMATVTLTNGGSGYTLGAPSFAAVSATGGKNAVVGVTVSPSGVVTALTILFHGNGYTTSGSLVVTNPITGGSGAAGTFTVDIRPILEGTQIYNKDSSCYQQYSAAHGWENMVYRGTGGGIGTETDPLWSASASFGISGSDITNWNAKQGAITLTNTGTSGVATLVGSTLNIPNYTVGGEGLDATLAISNTSNRSIILNSGTLRFDNANNTTYVNGGSGNTGVRNTFTGLLSGENNTASDITVNGYSAGRNMTGSIDGATAFGALAGSGQSGDSFTGVGFRTGGNNTGRKFTGVGRSAGFNNTFHNVTAVGYSATANANNQLVFSDSIFNIKMNGLGGSNGDVLTKVGGLWVPQTPVVGLTDVEVAAQIHDSLPHGTIVFSPTQFEYSVGRDSIFSKTGVNQISFGGSANGRLTGTDNATLDGSGNVSFAGTATVSALLTANGGLIASGVINLASPDQSCSFTTSTDLILGGDPTSVTGIKISRSESATPNVVTINANNGTILSTPLTIGIDLSSGSYTVTGPGTYYISTGSLTNEISLPDPTTLTTKNTIDVYLVINKNTSAPVSDSGANDIYDNNDTILTTLTGGSGTYTMYHLQPVNGHWVRD